MLNTVLASLSEGAPPVALSSYESIATVTVGSGGASDVTFSSIPATYTHLQVRAIARSNASDTGRNIIMQLNTDTGGNYSLHYLEANGSSVSAGGGASTTYMLSGRMTAATATASAFGALVIDVLDYANTNKYKTIRCLTGADTNGAGSVRLDSGNWRNTNAITSIKFTSSEADNFVQYSQFALYGIKGS